MCNCVKSVPDKVFNQTVELTRFLMDKYNVPPSRVIRHWDVNGKECPARWVGRNNDGWNKFKRAIVGEEESEKVSEKKENTIYHDTWMLLKKYRDVVWSLELSVRQVCNRFQIEYGSTVDEFLESIYCAGADIGGSEIEQHAKSIERSRNMLKLLDSSVELLREKHKYGEEYYWLLYYTFLSPHKLLNVDEIIEKLEPHIRDISIRTYYRRRRQAIEALSSVLWGYTAKDSLDVLEHFFPEKM